MPFKMKAALKMTDRYDPFRISAYNPGPAFKASSHYGYRDPQFGKRRPDQKGKQEFHSGQDYAAPAGTPIPNAAAGVVVYSGFNKNLGNTVIVRNDRGDYSLYGHMQDGDRAQFGQRIEEGDTIGAVGQTGARVKGVHLHYSVIRPEAGAIVGKGPGNGGSIGIHLDGFTTNDPAGLPRYLGETSRAMGIMSGGNTSATLGTPPPNRPGNPFFSPFSQTTPASMAATTSSFALPGLSGAGPVPGSLEQRPAFPQTASSGGNPPTRAPLLPNGPQGQLGTQRQFSPGSPIPGAEGPTSLGGPNGHAPLVLPQPVPNQGKRSDVPGGVTPDATQATAPATPANWAFPSQGPAGLGGVLKYFNTVSPGTAQDLPLVDPNILASPMSGIASGGNTQAPRLVRRLVNLSAPATGAPPLAPDSQSPFNNGNAAFGAAASSGANAPPSQPLLGIVSGKPMPDYPVWPSIFQTKDQQNDQSADGDNELVQRWLRWANA